MAKDKKPSIFTDRANIGSPDELDEYGVWVKSEPQDLSQAFPEIDGIPTEIPDTSELDSVIPDLEDLPDFDTLGVVSQDSDASLNIPDDGFSLPDLEIDDKTDKAPGEDNDSDVFNFGELSEPVDLDSGDLDSAKLNSVEPEPASDNDEDFKEISMDEFVGTQESTDSLEPDNPLKLDDSLELDDPLKLDESLELDRPDESKDSFESSDSLEPAAQIESIAETENVIAAAPALPKEKETVKGTQTMDLSTQLLMKIAEELSSIRNELSSLKKEFSGLKTAAPQAESTDKDILGEEDDEKISLTGDEMNNILNTADFTEEAGSDAGIGLSEENEDDSDDLSLSTADLDMEIDLSDPNLETPEGETKPESTSPDDETDETVNNNDNQASADTETPDDSIIDFSSSDIGELNKIIENGVEPMTPPPAPEDTNYLTNDPLAESADSKDPLPDLAEAADDESAEESIDLSGAVIDEPDLSLEIHDNPLEEPSLEDISISLDLSDLDTPSIDSPEPDSSESGSIELESPKNDTAAPLSEDAQGGEELSLLPEGFEVGEEDLGDISGQENSLDEFREEIEEIQEIPEDVIEEIEDFVPGAEIEAEESVPASPEPEPVPEPVVAEAPASTAEISGIPANLKTELKTVLSYMDQLLEALPDDKIEEFAKSDYYDTYKKLFKELGLV